MITENGWPSCGADALDRSPIPGTGIVLPLQRGIPSKIMKAFAADFNVYVEPLAVGRDEGGWTPTNSVATSNHLGGTAMDLNWNQHPMGPSYAGYSQAEIAEIRKLLAFYEGTIYWGQDWNTPKDGMHFQMGYGTYNNQAMCNDFISRKIRADGFSTYRRSSELDPKAFPLPAGYFYGPLDGDENSISGDYESDLQSWKDGLGRWQAALGLPVTKHWDDATKAAASYIQRAKGWKPTPKIGYGCVYEGEWNLVIRDGYRLPDQEKPPPPPPPAKKPVVVGPADDQLTLRWNCLGGQTLVETVAELRDHLLGTNDKDKKGAVVG